MSAKTTVTAKQLKEIMGKPVRKGCLKFVNDRLAGAGQVDPGYVRELVEEFEGATAPAPSETTTETSTPATPEPVTGTTSGSKANRFQVFGTSATAVLRAMGKQGGFSPKGALAALTALGADGLSMTTVRIQLLAGKKGQRGAPATLTSKQLQELTKLAKAAEKASA